MRLSRIRKFYYSPKTTQVLTPTTLAPERPKMNIRLHWYGWEVF